MGQAKEALSRKQRLLAEHQYCCFCGGNARSTTVDHIPPRACFPAGYHPEDFEFPACKPCNNGTSKDDQIFAYYSRLADFNEDNRNPAEMEKLRNAIIERCPNALPTAVGWKGFPSDTLIRPAVEVNVPEEFRSAAITTGRKLACALNYRERKMILTTSHLIKTGLVQIQNPSANTLITYFSHLLPEETIGSRSNIKQYGSRFMYKAGVKEEDDFFVYAAQFGHGFIIWGIVTQSCTMMGEPLDSIASWPIFGPHAAAAQCT
jgi:hypothetical protein